MSNLVIVAIPDENDRAWKVSSEKIPHLTLLFLGEGQSDENVIKITEFLQHAVNTTMQRFYLPVDRRGKLGDDEADVLFFKKGRYDYKAIRDFRNTLLQNEAIRSAYDSAEQYPVWTPHLTLGYPASPAKKPDEHEFPFYDVQFNKIAIWTGDYDGPEFLLKDYWDDFDEVGIPMDVSMSDIAHYGKKGMRWGIRNDRQGRDRFDPKGHSVEGDAIRALVLPPGANVPAAIRLGKRGAAAVKTSRSAKKEAEWDSLTKPQMGTKPAVHVVASKAMKSSKPEMDALNKEYAKQEMFKNGKYKTPEGRAALKDYNRSQEKIYMAHVQKHFDDLPDSVRRSPSGSRKLVLEETAHTWTIGTEEVAHAMDMELFAVRPIRDENQMITDLVLVEDELAQTAELGAEFIAHYGTKGMKWGVRRYGPAAAGAGVTALNVAKGKPTAAYMTTYATLKANEAAAKSAGPRPKKDTTPPEAKAATATSVVPKGAKAKTKIKVDGGENHDAAPEAIKVAEAKAKLIKSGPAALSNQELRDVVTRSQLELQAKQAVQSAPNKFISGLLKSQGQQSANRFISKKAQKIA